MNTKKRTNYFFQFSIFNFQLIIAVIVTLAAARPASAWGDHGHLISNEAAAAGLPTDMPHFFLRNFAELTWLGPEPDRWRNAGDSLEAWSEPDHFLDYEYAAGLKLPASRYEFIELMEKEGRHRRHGIDYSTAGFAPWRIAELSELLTNQFRRWRSTPVTAPERAMIERGIIQTAGILGHYVADSANPHHTTIHYNGWASAENPQRFAIDCGTHLRFESVFVSRAVDIDDVTTKLSAPVLRKDYFAAAMELIDASHALVDDLYTLDREGAFDRMQKPSSRGLAFATDRIAAGSSMLRDLWWSAWKNSASAPRRRSED